MTAVWVILLLLAALAVYSRAQKAQRRRQTLQKIRADWGQEARREYSWEEYERISHYFYWKQEKEEDSTFVIDDITWNDLNMDQVFRKINRTYSSAGEEFLYDMMRRPLFSRKETDRRERLICHFQQETEQREQIQLEYCRMGRVRKIALADYMFRFAQLTPKSPIRHWIQALALVAALAGLLIQPSVFILCMIMVVGFNIYTYYQLKPEVEPYFSCIGYLLAMADGASRIQPLCGGEAKAYGDRAKKAGAVFHKIKKYAGLIQYREAYAVSLQDMLMDYVRMLLHVDLIAFEAVRRYVAAHEAQIAELFESLGMLEACIAAASYRESLEAWAVPELYEEGPLGYAGHNMYHSLLTDPVKNSIDEDHSVLITGSNASGKSTFLKTAAINALLAQTIVTCLADSYRGRFYKIYSSMALKDDIQSAESYYIVEIRALKRILDQARGDIPVLCFVDEVLRGTNTVERIAASSQILKSLPDRQVFCFAATHDIELTHLLEKLYHNYHFEEQIGEKDIYFPYRLIPGRAVSRNAIRLLALMGYDSRIIREAEDTAEHFVKTGEWKL